MTLVTTSKALVTRSDALVPSSVLVPKNAQKMLSNATAESASLQMSLGQAKAQAWPSVRIVLLL